jgi:peptide/nickel transport system substrate-binding protein
VARTRTALAAVLFVAVAATAAWWFIGRRADPLATPAGETRPARGGDLVASLRSEPRNYNRYFEASAAADLVALLTQARLVRVNRATDELEPALAESWTRSADGLTYTVTLRPDVVFSDGVPFTSADVLFSVDVAYDAQGSLMAPALLPGGQRVQVRAPDPRTVVVTMAAPNPGLRLLDNLPILPKHRLEAAFRSQTLKDAWVPSRPVSDIAGLGPFVLTEHAPGQRLVFSRNPRYWRRDAQGGALPYLDTLTVLIINSQDAEALRLESGGTDLMSNADIRSEDYARFKRLSDAGRLQLIDGGVGLDPNVVWFNLTVPAASDRKPWLRTSAFRQALSYAADRQAIANSVYLGAGEPVYGPVTSRNRTWFSADVPSHPHDEARARQLLAAAGLTDRDGDGVLDDRSGSPVRFSILLQKDHTIRERTGAMLQEQWRRLGVAVDLVGLDPGAVGQRWQAGDYDAILHGFQSSATDPLMNLDFWLSSGNSHFWNPRQPKPATGWEATIDDLMRQQATAATLADRQRLFLEVQRVFAEHLPALYIVAPKVTIAVSPRVRNAQPAPQIPQLLWSADTLASGQRQ